MPKRKSKSSKLGRMSDEERARYLQHRAELELEAKRRKQQLIAIFTKNKLKREEAFSRLNTAKINEQWRSILRQIKCKELYDDVEHLWNDSERLMKVKDSIIRKLYRELEDADLDHRKLQETHIDKIDNTIEKQRQKLSSLHDFHMEKINDIKSNEVMEIKQLSNEFGQNCNVMKSIIGRKSNIASEKISENRAHNFVNIYNIIYLKDEMMSQLMGKTSNEMECLWYELNEVIDNYEATTKDKKKQYDYLNEQDNAHQISVLQYKKQKVQLENMIETLKSDLENLSIKREDCISKLKKATEEMKKKMEYLREDFTQKQVSDTMHLKKLTVVSTNVLKDLQEIAKKGTTMTQLINIYSNLMPLLSTLKKYSLEDSESEVSSNNVVSSSPFDKLENFWKEYNYIVADKILLKKEIEQLNLENEKSKHTLRMYLLNMSGFGVSCPTTSLSL